MNNTPIHPPPGGNLRRAVDSFWETFPPFWHRIRAHIRLTAASQDDLSVEQFHILRHIRRGQQSVSELAQVINISRPAISQGVNTLVNKGLVRRTTDKSDRRYVQLTLSDAGNALLDGIFDSTKQKMEALFSLLNDDELELLIHAMEILKKV